MKTKTQSAIKFITMTAVIAALYAIFTITCTPFAYGAIQFRLSEIMVLLCFWNKKHSVGLIGYRADGFFNVGVDELHLYKEIDALVIHYELNDLFGGRYSAYRF